MTELPRRVLLLPGLDGTGTLFQPMVEAAPAGVELRVLDYQGCGYGPPGAMEIVEPHLPLSGRAVVVAESYSGPLAVRLAARHPARVSHLVLAASFVRAPIPGGVLAPVGRLVQLLRPPEFALRFLLLGSGADRVLVDRLQAATSSVPASTLAHRIREIAGVDVTDELGQVEAPILYLQATGDRLVGPRAVDLIRKIRPDVRVERVRAPHLVLQREPAWAWERILEFVEG